MCPVAIAHVAMAAFELDIVCKLLHDTAPSLLHPDVKVPNGHEEPPDAGRRAGGVGLIKQWDANGEGESGRIKKKLLPATL